MGLTLNGWGFLLPFSYSNTEIKSQNLRDIFRSYFLSRYDSRSSSVTGGISRMKLVHCTSYKPLTKEEIQKKLKEPEKFIVTSSETKIFYISQLELVRKGIDELGWDYYLEKLKRRFPSSLGPIGSLEYQLQSSFHNMEYDYECLKIKSGKNLKSIRGQYTSISLINTKKVLLSF